VKNGTTKSRWSEFHHHIRFDNLVVDCPQRIDFSDDRHARDEEYLMGKFNLDDESHRMKIISILFPSLHLLIQNVRWKRGNAANVKTGPPYYWASLDEQSRYRPFRFCSLPGLADRWHLLAYKSMLLATVMSSIINWSVQKKGGGLVENVKSLVCTKQLE
jgi:hypothetical protein